MAKKPAEKEKSNLVQWIVNVKYRGMRYKSGDQAEIQPEDLESLVADGLIRVDDE